VPPRKLVSLPFANSGRLVSRRRLVLDGLGAVGLSGFSTAVYASAVEPERLPDIFVQVPDRVALTLCGHTHGGQIRVPLLWPHFVPSRYGTRFAYGHVVERNRHMIVSGGLGTSFVPVRLGVPPEIVSIELRGAASS
jgi:hypothetical protein